MADTKLTDLPPLTAAFGNDMMYIVDMYPVLSGESCKISLSNLFGNLKTNIISSESIQAYSVEATTTVNCDTINAIAAVTTDQLFATTLTTSTLRYDVIVDTITTTKTFEDPLENSRTFNFDTSSGNLSAIFTESIPDGFGVYITNIGTNTVYISSTQVPPICAASNKCNTLFGGLRIYKANGKLFGTGSFT